MGFAIYVILMITCNSYDILINGTIENVYNEARALYYHYDNSD